MWLKVSFHVIHACAPVCCSLSVSPHPSFHFLVLFLFQLYLMSNSAPDEFSIEDPLCNSSLGSMVTLDCATPLTHGEPVSMLPEDYELLPHAFRQKCGKIRDSKLPGQSYYEAFQEKLHEGQCGRRRSFRSKQTGNGKKLRHPS